METIQTIGETKPEQYLRQIRDAQQLIEEYQKKNTELLEELVEQKRSEIKWQHWRGAGKMIVIFLPYALTAWLSWSFYTSIQKSLSSITSAPQSAFESITTGAKKIWSEKDTVLEEGKDTTQTLLEKAKSYWQLP